MNILYISSGDDKVADLLAFKFESRFGVRFHREPDIETAKTEMLRAIANQDALEVIRKAGPQENIEKVLRDASEYHLIIIDENHDFSELCAFLLIEEIHIPIVVVCSDKQKTAEKFKQLAITDFSFIEDIQAELTPILDSLASHPEISGPDSLFCPIRVETIQAVNPVPCDLYIRLSPFKYVRIFAAGDNFDNDDLFRFQSEKKLDHLFLKRENFELIFSLMEQRLNEALEDYLMTKEQERQVIDESYTAVRAMVPRIGFTAEVMDIAEKSVRLAVKSMANNPKIVQIIKTYATNRKDYLQKHSLILAEVACALAVETNCGNSQNFLKLTAAAFFHDITMGNLDIVKCNSLQEAEQKGFSKEDIEKFKRHPIEGAEFIANFHELPSDAVEIVRQHHERPDGSGFPRGLRASRINKLAALFIIAHDVTKAVCLKVDQFDLTEYFHSAKAKFSDDKFREFIAVFQEHQDKENAA